MAGGGLKYKEDREYNEEILEDRKLTLEKIAEAGFRRQVRKVEWNTENSIQVLILFTAERRAEYESNPDESDEEIDE